MNSQQIRYVITVAEEKSFSKAARKLFITQPSLSQVISKLETQLDAQLFDRSTNPLQITQAGRIFLKHAKEICLREEMIKNEISEISELKSGILNIGTTPFLASCLLVPSITSFNRKYNNISIRISEEEPENLKKLILEGNIDIAVTKGKFSSELFSAEKIMSDRLYIAVAENNPINRTLTSFRISADDIKNNMIRKIPEKPVDMAVFRKEKFLVIRHDKTVEEISDKFSEDFGFTPDIAMCANHISTIFSFVLSGMGVALIPEMFIKFSNIMYHAVYYQADAWCSDIFMISKKDRNIGRAANEYKNILKQFAVSLSRRYYP